MDPDTGNLYRTREEAEKAGADLSRLVRLDGAEEDICSVSDAVKAQRAAEQRKAVSKRRRMNKASRQARKRNR